MFATMATISSAGTTLLIPDCEFTEMKTADVFYGKQIFFTFAVPVIFCCSGLLWCLIYLIAKTCGGSRWKSTKWVDIKNWMILTITLVVFLCYPMLVRICLSMLKCPDVNGRSYLMADLEESCFDGRHVTYLIFLTIPQMVVLTVLPLAVFVLLHRNKKHLDQPNFRTRYGLLYKGYTKDREWWEVTVAFRKVIAVAIGTFGTLIGIPEVQVGLALFLGLISIVMHMVGQPFGSPNGKSKTLHFMELYSLVVIWCVNWGGLMLFVVKKQMIYGTLLSIFIIGLVCLYIVFASFVFGKTFVTTVLDRRKERRVSRSASSAAAAAATASVGSTKVIPTAATNQDENQDETQEQAQVHDWK